ncbi:hypothetical protein C8R41DRAFT_916424 [Lentinula lateritia]|uniref:Uncharacterized protein n=1 Tax=Lentinula lateritia TaxID=40482 RepID=A0ABQ8VQ79_9AGAR|nr:hypothetical protein C8R41DRAFT_916424 [Lentinula lateritia]
MIRSKRRYYDALAPDSNDYNDSQNLTTPKCPHLQQQNFTAKREMAESQPLTPRCSHLEAREANKELAHPLALDDDVGSQEFIENLFKSRGLDPALVQREYFEDGASDIDNQVHIEEPQSQIVHYSSPVPSSPSKPCISLDYCITVNEDGIVELGNQERNNNLAFCPHSVIPCACTAFLLQEYRTLNQQLSSSRDLNDRYERKLYRQEVCLKRLQDSLFTAVSLLTPTNVEGHGLSNCLTELEHVKEDLQKVQEELKISEHGRREVERLRRNIYHLVADRTINELSRVNNEVENITS